MADRSTKVILTAQVAQYVSGMAEAARATRETGSATEKLAQQQQAFEQMGRASMVAGGAIAAGLALSAKAAIDWNSAWAGVTKTVDGTPEQLAQVQAGLRGLTDVLPASHTEIAAVAEAAGQLGIQTPNVVAFTRTMIDLGETTNLSSEQAAMSLARFMNIMGTAQGDVSNLGSALVGLGNNYATTESEILEMSTRLAKSGVQIGLTEGEVFGLATSLSSVGIEAEAGGSAMSKVMIDIAASVETGGDKLEMFAKTAGMSAQEFSEKWKSNPAEALAAFVKGLADAEAQGGSTLGVLAELGITEVRMRDALLGSAAAADDFAGAMEMGNAEFEKNKALVEEAEKRYETTAAKLGIMRNKVVDSAIAIGEQLLPAVEGIADGIGNFADMIGGFEGPGAAFVAWTGVAASGVLLFGGVALAAVPKIAAYKVAMETLNISTNGVSRGLRGVGSFLMGPWGIALGLATASAAAFNAEIEKGVPSQTEITAGLKASSSAADQLRAASERGGMETALWGDYQDSLSKLPEVLTKAKVAQDNWVVGMAMGEPQYKGAIDSLKRLGDSYGEMAAADLPRAQESFAQLRDEYKLTDEQTSQLLTQMPAFRDALLGAADAAGVGTDDASLLKFALGEIGPAAKDGAAGADDQAKSLEELQGVAASTSEEVSKLADEIRNFGSAQFDVERAAISFNEAFAGLQANLDGGSASLDLTSEAGRETTNALLDAAQSTNDYAAATFAMGGSTESVQGILEAGRQNIINSRIALGDSAEAAQAYADKLIATPEAIYTASQFDSSAAETAIANYNAVLGNIRSTVTTAVSATVDILTNLSSDSSANGNIFAYANGGISTGIYSGGAPIHKFAEPETGWEAYISGKPSERERNRQIWSETGNRLGMAGAGQSTVYVPTSLKVYDADNKFLGTMGAVADQKIDAANEQQAREQRKAGQ